MWPGGRTPHRDTAWWRDATALVVLLGFTAFAIAVAPHLVHHLFEQGDHHHDPPCMYAVAAERHEPLMAPAPPVAECADRGAPVVADHVGAVAVRRPLTVAARSPPRLLA